MKKTKKIFWGSLLGVLFFSLVVISQSAQADNNKSNRPPQGNQKELLNGSRGGTMKPENKMGMNSSEAKEACKDLSESDSCSFVMTLPNEKEKEIEGTCVVSPQDENELSCKPGNRERNGFTLENRIQKTEEVMARRGNDFSRIEERLQKLIDFFESKGIDASELEEDLKTFQSKSDAILESIRNYFDILEELKENGTEELNNEAKEAREETKNLVDDLKDFYKNILKAEIGDLMEELKSLEN